MSTKWRASHCCSTSVKECAEVRSRRVPSLIAEVTANSMVAIPQSRQPNGCGRQPGMAKIRPMIPGSGGDRGVTEASSRAGMCVGGCVCGPADVSDASNASGSLGVSGVPGVPGTPGASWDPGGLGPASTGSFGDFGSFADSTLLLLTCSTQS